MINIANWTEFDAEGSMGCLRLQVDNMPRSHLWNSQFQKCPNKSFSLIKVLVWYNWMELWLQNCSFAHIWSWGGLDLWPVDLKFPEISNTALISFFDWKQFLSGIAEWSYGSKTAFLPIFGQIVTLTFDLWTSNFQICLTLPQYVFFDDKRCYLVHLNGFMAPNLNFCPYLVMWWPQLLTCKTQNLINSLSC